MNPEQLTSTLRLARTEANITLLALSTASTVHSNTITRMELGHCSPTLDAFWRIATSLGYQITLTKESN